MSIVQAFKNAYEKAEKRRYSKIYVAIDLHDTIVTSSYTNNDAPAFINRDVVECLRLLSKREEVIIILWSGLKEEDKGKFLQFFSKNAIKIDYINENPRERGNSYANFDDKFYFSVLIDDKAGFDPKTDWKAITKWYQEENA